MYKSILLPVLFITTACSQVINTPAKPYDINLSQTFNLNYDKTWSKAVDWFADHNVSIEKIDKQSGLLTAKYLLEVDSTKLDCGTFEEKGTTGRPTLKKYGKLNVTVRKTNNSSSKVRVNFFGEYEYIVLDLWDARPVTYTGKCTSTGEIENHIFNYIES